LAVANDSKADISDPLPSVIRPLVNQLPFPPNQPR
jgi:hypothetical protein